MDEKQLLQEIRALLEEQNRLLSSLKAQTESIAAHNARHAKQSHVRFWVVFAGVLLLLLFPNITAH